MCKKSDVLNILYDELNWLRKLIKKLIINTIVYSILFTCRKTTSFLNSQCKVTASFNMEPLTWRTSLNMKLFCTLSSWGSTHVLVINDIVFCHANLNEPNVAESCRTLTIVERDHHASLPRRGCCWWWWRILMVQPSSWRISSGASTILWEQSWWQKVVLVAGVLTTCGSVTINKSLLKTKLNNFSTEFWVIFQ